MTELRTAYDAPDGNAEDRLTNDVPTRDAMGGAQDPHDMYEGHDGALIDDAPLTPRPHIDDDGRRRTVRYGNLTLFSAFEPIFSVSHMRAAGYEAKLRAHDELNQSVSPLSVFSQAARLGDLLELDRLSQSLHLANFRGLRQDHGWLFLNIHPAAIADFRHGAALIDELRRLEISPQRIVLQVLEQPNTDPRRVLEAVQLFRRHGFLIALDDFGAGHSIIDRVWKVQPDIVKLDRSILFQATQQAHVARILPGLVSLLHESGRLVLVEGIASEQEALIAIEANVDFVQGHYFARPSVSPADAAASYQCFDTLIDHYRDRVEARERDDTAELAPYVAAVAAAAQALANGATLDRACDPFLQLPDAARCFVLDDRGRQTGDNLLPPRPLRPRARRFMPLMNSEGARWDRRPYFRRAIADSGEVQATRPYLSINEAHLCVTVSVAYRSAEGLRVLCADVDWTRHDRSTYAPRGMS